MLIVGSISRRQWVGSITGVSRLFQYPLWSWITVTSTIPGLSKKKSQETYYVSQIWETNKPPF